MEFSSEEAIALALEKARQAVSKQETMKTWVAVAGWVLALMLGVALIGLTPLKQPVGFAFERQGSEIRFLQMVDQSSSLFNDEKFILAQIRDFVKKKEEYSCYSFQANFSQVYVWLDQRLATIYQQESRKPTHVFQEKECSVAYQINVDSASYVDAFAGEKKDTALKSPTGDQGEQIRTALVMYTRAQVDPTSGRILASDKFQVKVSFYQAKNMPTLAVNPAGIKVVGYAREDSGSNK